MSTFLPQNDGKEKYKVIVQLVVIDGPEGDEYYPHGEEEVTVEDRYEDAVDRIHRIMERL